MSRIVLLNRDGVINQRVVGGYVTCWSHFVFLPGALDGLRLLTQRNYEAIVVSNQACVGKGLLSSSGLEEITHRFLAQVAEHGGRIYGVYYCTHRKEDGCECRKPKPGLLLKAQKEHRSGFADTFLIGDSETDLLAAKAVGCRAILIASGNRPNPGEVDCPPRAVVSNLREAAEYIIGNSRREAR